MNPAYAVAVVGSGPAGMSAAARAAKRGVSHILLERAPHATDTVFNFHKKKHVMAAPERLPLRSDLGFSEGTREAIIETWERNLEDARVNVRYKAEVTSISGQCGAFEIALADGDTLMAAHVIVAVGVQGNPRKLAIPGADLPFVQYQLDDPDEYRGEAILVIGGGDAAIENALALADGNDVVIVNRGRDYPRARPANATRIRGAISRRDVREFANAYPKRIGLGYAVLETMSGEVRLKCDRVIARIGTEARPQWLERAGVNFAGGAPDSLPLLSGTHESSVPGLYVIGAMAGSPLIKHCLKQGYEVVEAILGHTVQPIDEPLLQGKLARAGVPITVDELVTVVRQCLQLYAPLTVQQVRECLIHSEIRLARKGDIIFRQGDYTTSLFSILVGEVGLGIDHGGRPAIATFKPGQFFGEMELISGRRRAATATALAPSLLLEIDRSAVVRLIRSVPAVKREIESATIIRHLKAYLAPSVPDATLAALASAAALVKFGPNDLLITEGGDDDFVYIICKGAVTVSRRRDGRDDIVDYLTAGNDVGIGAMLGKSPPVATITSTGPTEAIRIDGVVMRRLVDADPVLRQAIEERLLAQSMERQQRQPDAKTSGIIEFLVRQRVGEAANVLVIDEALCVRCDNCEKACAETHHGVARLVREAGPTFDHVHLPVACRHCEHPACMEDCPTDSIRRTQDGEILIDDTCNGCGNCERNCPFGAIQMASPPLSQRPAGLLTWLLFGRGREPGENRMPAAMAKHTGHHKAVKCDLCAGIDGGPACVRACPTGAAIRATPETYISHMLQARPRARTSNG